MTPLNELVAQGSADGAVPAVLVVQYCLSGVKDAEQCKRCLKYWIQQCSLRLPIRELGSGKAVPAIETATQLRTVAGRCIKAGADGTRVAGAVGRIKDVLDANGASTSRANAGASVPWVSP